MKCAYCGELATVRIPAFPEAVCNDHAIEFWASLLKFASDQRAACAVAT